MIYVLFSSGVVLSKSHLQEVELKQNLEKLISKIHEWVQHGNKVILCGHSMGCTLAMFAGYQFFLYDKNMFYEHVSILGTGGAKWMTHEICDTFSGFTNVHIFISGVLGLGLNEQNSAMTIKTMILDGFQNIGDEYEVVNPNCQVIFTETDGEVNNVEITERTKVTLIKQKVLKDDHKVQMTHANVNSMIGQTLHSWSHYRSLLQRIFSPRPTVNRW
jgi:hypothetical protein